MSKSLESTRFNLLLIVGAFLIIDEVVSAPLQIDQHQEKGKLIAGFSLANINDNDVKVIADFATTAIAENTNSGPVKLVELVKAETQVVDGINYKLSLELVSTGTDSKSLLCEAIVFDQPWTNTRKLTQSSCAPVEKRRVWLIQLNKSSNLSMPCVVCVPYKKLLAIRSDWNRCHHSGKYTNLWRYLDCCFSSFVIEP